MATVSLVLVALMITSSVVFAALKYSLVTNWPPRSFEPFSVDVDSIGNVYIANTGNSMVQKFTSDGTFIKEWGPNGTSNDNFSSGEPVGIAVDSSANVYVIDTDKDVVQKFSSDGTLITMFHITPLQYGTAIAVDSASNIYLPSVNAIDKFSSNGTFIARLGTRTNDTDPTNGISLTERRSYKLGIAVDSAGNIYVPVYPTHSINKFDRNGTFTMSWGTECELNAENASQSKCIDPDGSGPLHKGDGQFFLPAGIAVDSHGNVYVADSGNERIQKFTSDGKFITTLYEGYWKGTHSPRDVAVDNAGNVYVADLSLLKIEIYAPLSTQSSTNSTSSNQAALINKYAEVL